MRRVSLGLLFVLAGSVAMADRYTLYIVYKSSLTVSNLTTFNAMKTKGISNHWQPAMTTKIIDYGHPYFCLLSISTQTQTESNQLNILEDNGVIKRIEEVEIYESGAKRKSYPMNVPKESEKWEVQKSS